MTDETQEIEIFDITPLEIAKEDTNTDEDETPAMYWWQRY